MSQIIFIPRVSGPILTGSPLLWGNNSVGATVNTRFLEPGFSANIAPTVLTNFLLPFDAVLDDLFILHGVPAGNGNLIVYTLLVEGVPTALTQSLASTSAIGSDAVNSVAVAQGSRIGIEVTKALGVGSSPGDVLVSCRATPT